MSFACPLIKIFKDLNAAWIYRKIDTGQFALESKLEKNIRFLFTKSCYSSVIKSEERFMHQDSY